MPGKMPRSDPRASVRVTRGAGSGQHLASVLQERRENANIDACLGFIWRISVQGRNPMARKQPRPEVSRRKFLAGAAVAGATTALAPPAAKAATTDGSISTPRRPSALPPTMQVAVAETATPKELPRIGGVPGSDFMVDVIKTLDIKYLPSNPASSFRAIHESLINYGGNKMPEFLTCAHEESAVGMAHGYF